MKMISSNGVAYITEIEAKLGDILRESFPREVPGFDSYIEAKRKMEDWARSHGVRTLSFWDYTETKRKSPELHLVPSPHPGTCTSSDTFLAFDDELAMKVLVLGCV